MSGPSSTFLEIHLATFEHAFDWVSVASQWIHESDLVRSLLTSNGCSGLPLEYCGVPKGLRAVCPVICGCPEEFLSPGCRSSCFPEIVSSTEGATYTNDTDDDE